MAEKEGGGRINGWHTREMLERKKRWVGEVKEKKERKEKTKYFVIMSWYNECHTLLPPSTPPATPPGSANVNGAKEAVEVAVLNTYIVGLVVPLIFLLYHSHHSADRKRRGLPAAEAADEPSLTVRNHRFASPLSSAWAGVATLAELFERTCRKHRQRLELGNTVAHLRPSLRIRLRTSGWTALGILGEERVAIYARHRETVGLLHCRCLFLSLSDLNSFSFFIFSSNGFRTLRLRSASTASPRPLRLRSASAASDLPPPPPLASSTSNLPPPPPLAPSTSDLPPSLPLACSAMCATSAASPHAGQSEKIEFRGYFAILIKYEALILRMIRKRDASHPEILDALLSSSSSDSAATICDLLIKTYVQAWKLREGSKSFHLLKQHGFSISINASNALLTATFIKVN
ncbi:hypothetical protein Fmac_016567 [Flemingia macrophylla]|uniref:Uncharacterized protein n=1 Tax=Flemingia macrophylla TaxID=520843 RepID=A0ABD1MHS9_9FABA